MRRFAKAKAAISQNVDQLALWMITLAIILAALFLLVI